jgi:hypothetical protein
MTEDATTHRPDTERYFFVHIMKTAGATLATQMWTHFDVGRMYGYGATEIDFLTSTYLYVNPRPMAFLPRERIEGMQLFGGHFPYAAIELMGDDVRTITVLRDPVDRVLSFLKHAQRFHDEHRDLPLEQIYEDEWYFTRFLDNHEVKMLSMTSTEMLGHAPEDGWAAQGWSPDEQALLARWRETPEALEPDERLRFHELAVDNLSTARGIYRLLGAPNTITVEIDDARLRRAIGTLRQIDVVGVLADYDAFMRRLSHRVGFELDSTVRRNASADDEPVPTTLRRRIADDLGPSLELYAAACEIATQHDT